MNNTAATATFNNVLNIFPGTYYNLTKTGASTATMCDDVHIDHDIDFDNGEISINGHTLTLDGNTIVGSGTILGSATSNLAITSSDGSNLYLPPIYGGLNNFTLDKTGNPDVELSGMTGLVINGTASFTNGTLSTEQDIDFNGSAVCGNGTMNSFNSGTITFNGSGAQSIFGGDYYNLTKSGNFTATLCANVNVSNDFTINAGTIETNIYNFTVNGTSNIDGIFNDNSPTGDDIFVGLVTIGGTWNTTALNNSTELYFRGGIINNGSFDAGGATFQTNAQTVSGTNTFNFDDNIVVENITLTNNGTVDVNGSMDGTAGGATDIWRQGTGSTLLYSSGSEPMVTGELDAENKQ